MQQDCQLQDICISCKTKIVDFFIFKRRNEEARKIFKDSSAFVPPVKNMLLEVVDQIENNMTSPEESQDEVIAEISNDDRLQLEAKEEFVDSNEAEEMHEIESQDDFRSFKDESLGDEMQEVEQLIEDDVMEDVNDEPEFLDEEEPVISIEITSTTSSASKTKPNRQAHPENWIRNKRKLAKNKGQSYIASNGKFIEAKQMKGNCGSSCRMQCYKKISEDNRQSNFNYFYQLADIAKQRKFLFDHMKTYEPKRNKVPKNPQKLRAVQRTYFLDLVHVNGETEMIQVCKLMFLNTFSISSQMIDTIHRKVINEGKFSDTRGKFERRQSKNSELVVGNFEENSTSRKEIPSKHKTDKISCDICSSYRKATTAEKIPLQKHFDEHAKSRNCQRLKSLIQKSRESFQSRPS